MYETRHHDRAWHLLSAGHWTDSHAVIIKHLAADAIINGKLHNDNNMVQSMYYSPVQLETKTAGNHVLFSFLYYCKVWYFRWLLCHNIFTRSFSRIINPSLKSENPASCLCIIALFQCMRPASLRILREMCVLENAKVVSVLRALSNLKHCKQWNITWPRLLRIYTGE